MLKTLTDTERDRIYRRNFFLLLGDFVLFTIGMGLIGASTVIPDFVRHLTDSEIVIGLSGQLFEIGWLLPQLLIARRLVRVAHKKWWFVGPSIPVRVLILCVGGCIVLLGANHRGAILAVFFVFYFLAALGDGLVGVPWLDLLGSSLDDKRRVRMFGLGTAVVGVLMIFVTPVIRLILGEHGPGFPNNYALLFAAAGCLFLSTLPVIAFIHELPGGQAQEVSPPLSEYLPDLWRILRHDRPYRAIFITRLLMGLFTLANPFYIGFATEQLKMPSGTAVSNLLLMQILGNVTGSLGFSWKGERHTLLFIRLSLVAAILQPIMALGASAAGPVLLYPSFFMAGIVQGVLWISFFNWIIGYATHEQRPIYAGLFNSLAAVSLVIAPLTGGTIVEVLSYEAVFAVALSIALCALFVATRYVRTPHKAAVETC